MTQNNNILLIFIMLVGLGLVYVSGLHDPIQYLRSAVVCGGGLGVIYGYRRIVRKDPVSPGFLAVWITYLAVPLTFWGLATR
jgi:hypothetical protein